MNTPHGDFRSDSDSYPSGGVIRRIGFIGAGHIAGYMLNGFMRSGDFLSFTLADPDPDRCQQLVWEHGCVTTQDNQEAVTGMDLVILAVRPVDLEAALAGLVFSPDQVVASVVAGAGLDRLSPLVAPARAVRVLPIACAVVNRSPVLIHPPLKSVEHFFSRLGRVHVLTDESAFTPGTALVGALFAWMMPLMEGMAQWTEDQGIDPETSRDLVVETIEGACAMARFQRELSLEDIWKTLATPGGISQRGADVLNEAGAFQAFCTALATVTRKMEAENEH
ncbi:MAG: NAD(P)-binding domain-containing protein [Desulfobacterales bacterium]|nr:NAD(P)-binding domain-containing protein [Desulfobacterales bacterium]